MRSKTSLGATGATGAGAGAGCKRGCSSEMASMYSKWHRQKRREPNVAAQLQAWLAQRRQAWHECAQFHLLNIRVALVHVRHCAVPPVVTLEPLHLAPGRRHEALHAVPSMMTRDPRGCV